MKKVVLITGASSGIGKEAAVLLAEDGYTVYGAARRVEKMKELEKLGVRLLKMDVSKDKDMVSGVEKIIKDEGRIDVLVNNAGYGSYGSLEDTPMSEAKYQFEVNVFGLARLTQLVLPHMRKQGSGKIINVSSIGGKIYEPHGAWYHSTKFAVEGLSDSIRLELKQFGIDVVIVEPGPIATEWNEIARENLKKVSGKTAYKDLALKHAAMMERFDERGSHPKVIGKVIHKAIKARRPRTRYPAGKMARSILFARKIMSDRMFDRIMMSMMK